MDKKAKKKVEVLRKRVDKLQVLLKGATEQMDDPGEVDRLRSELEEARTEISKLKAS